MFQLKELSKGREVGKQRLGGRAEENEIVKVDKRKHLIGEREGSIILINFL